MFDDHRRLDANIAGTNVVHVSSPYHYRRGGVYDDIGSYILICDNGKKFSLISTAQQLPDIVLVPGSYIQTDFKSGSFTSPASFVKPSDSPDIGYITQSILRTGNSTAYIAPCDLSLIKTDEDTSISSISLVPQMVWHGFFGQYGSYYPGNRNIVGNYDDPHFQVAVIENLNTCAYSAGNFFNTTNNSGMPHIASYVNKNLIRRDTNISPIYLEASFPTVYPINSCVATNYNIYNGDYSGWSAPMEGTTADGLSHQSYTLCYPISLCGNVTPLLNSLISDPVGFLSTNGMYARPFCRAFHVYGLESRYSFSWTPSFFIPGPFIGVLLTWTPATSKFGWSNYGVPTDKNMLFSSGMYANTDMLFSDIMQISVSSLSAGYRFQMMRSSIGSIVVKYRPENTFIYFDLIGPNAPPQVETDGLFYLTNGLNPEEYMFCDGVLFGKQQFKYSTFTKKSSNPMLYGGAWEPGEQNVLLRGISIVFDKGLLSSDYKKVKNSSDIETWEFSDVKIDSLSHGIGYINQIIQQCSSSSGLSDAQLDTRDYLSSCQAPYDIVFCDGYINEDEQFLKIEGCILLGMTSSQGLLDNVYETIKDYVSVDVNDRVHSGGSADFAFTIDVFTIILVSNDPDLLYSSAVSYEHVSTDPGISGWYITTLHGMNNPSRSITGPAFLYDDTGSYEYMLLKQKVTVSGTYTFEFDATDVQTSVGLAFAEFPFGACTKTIASARVSSDGKNYLVPLVIDSLTIYGGAPTLLGKLTLNDGEGLTFPKIVVFDNYVFTHTAKKILMLDKNGAILYETAIACVVHGEASHTYIDRFDLLIQDGIGDYCIGKYFESLSS